MGKSNFGQEELNKGKDGFPVGVVVYLLDKDNRVLLAKRSPHKRHAANKWEVISGGVKRSEQPDEAVRREVREELGEVDIEVGEIINAFTSTLDYGMRFVGISYLCRFWGGEIILNEEHTEYRWCDIEEAIKLADTEGVRQELIRIGERLEGK